LILTRFFPVLLLAIVAIGCTSSDSSQTLAELNDPSWEWQYPDSSAFFIGVHAVDESTVWAAGSNGQVVRTIDGGASWSSMIVPGADSIQFRDVHAFDGDHAFVLSIGNGTDSRIYRTSDGGATWDLSFQNEDENAFFDCFSFWDQPAGFDFSASSEGEFTLIRTPNGGYSWSRTDPELLPDASSGVVALAAVGPV